MFYTVYKVTNCVSRKTYIGKHQTNDLSDGYMGSGKLLKRAIRKYGHANFQKEILFIFDNEKDMNAKEKELVIVSEETYNLCEGGRGGFGYINELGLNYKGFGSVAERNRVISPFKKGHKLNGSGAQKGGRKTFELKVGAFDPKLPNGFLGKKHTKEVKDRISASMKEYRRNAWKSDREANGARLESDAV